MRLRVIVAAVGTLFAVGAHGQAGDLTVASASHAPKVLAATQAPLGVDGSDGGGEAPTPTTPEAGQPEQTEQKVFTLTTLTTTPPADIKSTPVPGFSFPPGTTYETVTVEHTATSGMEPIPTGLQAGTKVTFPSANLWWTLNAEAVAQWAPALPVSVNIELFNLDRSLLNYTYRLASSVTPGASSRTFIAGFPAHAGKGYVVHIKDAGNGTVYSASEPFEIKKEGSQIMLPAGYSSSSSPVSGNSQDSAASPTTAPPTLLMLFTTFALGLAFSTFSTSLSPLSRV